MIARQINKSVQSIVETWLNREENSRNAQWTEGEKKGAIFRESAVDAFAI